MRQARHVLMVALVATALCADRAVAAAPVGRTVARTQASSSVAGLFAGKFVRRLSRTLRQALPSVRLVETLSGTRPLFLAASVPQDLHIAPLRLTPFQFRLPPPGC